MLAKDGNWASPERTVARSYPALFCRNGALALARCARHHRKTLEQFTCSPERRSWCWRRERRP
jgi:hypothetical protein